MSQFPEGRPQAASDAQITKGLAEMAVRTPILRANPAKHPRLAFIAQQVRERGISGHAALGVRRLVVRGWWELDEHLMCAVIADPKGGPPACYVALVCLWRNNQCSQCPACLLALQNAWAVMGAALCAMLEPGRSTLQDADAALPGWEHKFPDYDPNFAPTDAED